MPIEVECEFCGRVLNAKDAMAGRTAKCPSCGGLVRIPGGDDGVLDAEVVEETGDVESSGPDETTGERSRKPCPMCGEMIAPNALECRFCGEDLTGRKKKRKRGGYGAGDEEMTGVDWVLCILCPGIGCIVGLIRVVQGNGTGGKMLGLSILFAILWNAIRFAILAGLDL